MIPFISQLPKQERQIWIVALNKMLPEFKVVDADDYPQAHKHVCTLAIVANPEIESLSQFPNVTWLHSVWAGVEKLMSALANSPIAVVRLIDPTLTQTMAEAVLAWSLYLHRDMPAYAKQQQQNQWLQHQHTLASDRRIGILGLGELGCASAKKLYDNGFNVIGWSRTEKTIANIPCYSGNDGLREMVSKSDILICLLPLTPSTAGLVNGDLLMAMPKGSAVINFARGGIINTDDLILALDNKQLKHAVLDVFEVEPLATSSELWQHPDITVLPHISAPTHINSASAIVAKNISHFFTTGQLPACVNKVRGY
jgi:glyoxylate/hydroxypyruvate reductase A